MDLVGKAKRVRIYVNEGDRVGHRPAHLAVLEWLRKENAEGATLVRGLAGFGAAGQLHTANLVDIAQNLPCVIEWIDASDVVERLMPRLKEMIPYGLVTIEETEIVLHRRRGVRSLPELLRTGEVMTRNVRSVSPETPLREVVESMLAKTYRAVPVVEDGVPVGIITNGDLVQRGGLAVRLELLTRLGREDVREALERLQALTARDVMTSNPVTVRTEAPVGEVAEIMARRRLKRLPVVDAQSRLVGLVSRLDLLRIVAAGGVDRPAPEPRELGLAGDVPLAQVMRRDVPTVTLDTPLAETFQAVISTRLNRAMVVDADRRVKGLITDAELLDRVAPTLRPGALRSLMHRLPFKHARDPRSATEQHAEARFARDLMSTVVATAPETAPLSEAVALMLSGGQKVLAIVDADGRLSGIVDRADVLHGLVREASGAP